jgi:hypothetical protein
MVSTVVCRFCFAKAEKDRIRNARRNANTSEGKEERRRSGVMAEGRTHPFQTKKEKEKERHKY